MMIFHIALASDWAEAKAAGSYTVSTRGRTLAEEGFIHASRADQWTGVREAFYSDVTEPLLLLQIDTDLLDVPVVEEPAVPGGTETRSEEHTSELPSLMRISYAVFCLKKKNI